MTSQLKFNAISCFLSGLTLIFIPGIRRYVFIPLLINTILFSLASWLLWHYMASMLDSILPRWLDWLSWLLLPFFSFIIFALVYFSFTLFANIIASPFYIYLALQVERELCANAVEVETSRSFWLESISVMGTEVRKILYYLVRAIPLILLSIIPGINLITLPLWFLFSAWFIAFEYTGYYFENHHVLFEQQKKHLTKNRLNVLVFGSLNLLLTSIPVINLFAPAIGVAGATSMQLRQE